MGDELRIRTLAGGGGGDGFPACDDDAAVEVGGCMNGRPGSIRVAGMRTAGE